MKRAAKIWRAVLSLAVVILIFGIWRLPVGEERYSVIGAWIQVFRAESFMDFWLRSPADYFKADAARDPSTRVARSG